MRILVTDGDNRAALAIVRSLGRAGHWVAVGSPAPKALAKASKYCMHRVEYPDPIRHESDCLKALADAARTLEIDVVLPVTDITTILITSNRDRFPKARIPFADADMIMAAADKVGVLRRAKQIGVPAPKTIVIGSRSESLAKLDLAFPVVIKPARSRVRTAKGWISAAVSYASDVDSLKRTLDSLSDEQFPVALQEKIDGPGLGVFLCYANGKAVASFAHQRLREKPPSGGVSVLCESVAVSPDTLCHAQRLLDDLNWDGVAMVEFKLDRRDGTPKLMEINGRFWGSLQLAIDAGVDFPKILVDCAAGRPPASPPVYRVGVKSRWLWGDVDSLFIQLFGSGSTADRVEGGRLGVLRDFFKLWQRDLHYENPRWSDLRPWFHETRRWLMGSR